MSITKKGLSKRQTRILDRIENKLKRCLEFYEDDKEEGYKNILRLIIAEKIRQTKRIRPVLPTRAKNDDERARMIENVTTLQSKRFFANLRQNQHELDAILSYLGGLHREDDELKVSYWKVKGIQKFL